ncbi:hypothetical protein BC351_00450 [Paenibacillus ferrarius]|uniref:HTH cro/C1-type domain-containing protein n=1 Tax=Paenibacillus ferrarius TaxID=1469647 RepID=A0A1V4HS99_9BACL|nr:helix-turn-helix transcriptional regulator [Paenibacillus ferrarius]OPH61746.1 hypothetical protein BC351_00450 [Paenibacillus ferrarius]
MFGLGKDRSRLGKFLDNNDITQEELKDSSGLSRDGISLLCKGKTNINPTENTMRKIVGALRRMGHDVDMEDFWG